MRGGKQRNWRSSHRQYAHAKPKEATMPSTVGRLQVMRSSPCKIANHGHLCKSRPDDDIRSSDPSSAKHHRRPQGPRRRTQTGHLKPRHPTTPTDKGCRRPSPCVDPPGTIAASAARRRIPDPRPGSSAPARGRRAICGPGTGPRRRARCARLQRERRRPRQSPGVSDSWTQ